MKRNKNELPLAVLRDIVNWLDSEHIKGVIIGGIAASIIGRPRVTNDIDCLIIGESVNLADFLTSAEAFGFVPRIKNTINFADQTKVLLLKHVNTEIEVDISLGFLPFEYETVKRSKKRKIRDINLPLPTPEDLIIMKAIAHRSKDILDIESIIDVNPKLDIRRILKWVGEFSEALEMPELLDDIQKLINKLAL